MVILKESLRKYPLFIPAEIFRQKDLFWSVWENKREFNLEKLRVAFAKVMRHLRGMNVKEAVTSVNLNLLPGKKDQIAQAMGRSFARALSIHPL